MTIGLSPTLDIGPVSVAWHGLLTAAGLVVAFFAAERFARARGLDPAPVSLMVLVVGAAGLVGARLFYLAQEDPIRLLAPWSGGSTGFAFYGSLILGIPAVAIALRLSRRPTLPYLDVAALAFPFGMALGRVGDLLNGEHYGRPTDLPWGVTYTDSASHAPQTGVAYHSGALYEILFVALLAAMLAIGHRRLAGPGDALWVVLGLYSLGRFVVFFWVDDVGIVGLGLRQAQWTSLALVAIAAVGLTIGGIGSADRGAPSAARTASP